MVADAASSSPSAAPSTVRTTTPLSGMPTSPGSPPSAGMSRIVSGDTSVIPYRSTTRAQRRECTELDVTGTEREHLGGDGAGVEQQPDVGVERTPRGAGRPRGAEHDRGRGGCHRAGIGRRALGEYPEARRVALR